MASVQRLSMRSPIHSQGYELIGTKSAHWLQMKWWRLPNFLFIWSFGFAFKRCLHSSTNVCWLLLFVSHNFIALAKWQLGVRASVVTANGYRFISTLTYHRSEKHRNTHVLYVPDCCAFNQSSAKTQRWMICRECSGANLKIPVSTVVLWWKTADISVPKQKGRAL